MGHPDRLFHVAAAVGISLGLGLMAAPAVLTREEGALAAAPGWVSTTLIVAGQLAAGAGAFAAGFPRAASPAGVARHRGAVRVVRLRPPRNARALPRLRARGGRIVARAGAIGGMMTRANYGFRWLT